MRSEVSSIDGVYEGVPILRCPVCDSRDVRPTWDGRRPRYRCGACGISYTHPDLKKAVREGTFLWSPHFPPPKAPSEAEVDAEFWDQMTLEDIALWHRVWN